jgi:hypothetical protein
MKFLTKPRIVFFAWAIAELIGWLTTHYIFRDPRANWVWLILSVLAFIPMVLYMPWKQHKMRAILLLWLISVAFGMAVSFLAFYVGWLGWVAPWLGVFWLILMGVTFLLNAIWWSPAQCFAGGALQIVAGVLVILLPGALLAGQYLVAAVAGTGAMLLLVPSPATFKRKRRAA